MSALEERVEHQEFGSLAHRVAQRRKEREARRKAPIILSVPGYDDLFAVKYRRLSISERSEIGDQYGLEDANGGAVAVLVRACEDILEITGTNEQGEPVYRELGRVWSPRTIANLFEEDFHPETTVREAMDRVFDEAELGRHFKEYMDEVLSMDANDREALPGESKLSVES